MRSLFREAASRIKPLVIRIAPGSGSSTPRRLVRIAGFAVALAAIASVIATAALASPSQSSFLPPPERPSHSFQLPPGRDIPNRIDPGPPLQPGAVARFTFSLAQLAGDTGGGVVETNF